MQQPTPCALFVLLLLLAVPALAEGPESESCEGRNPLHCQPEAPAPAAPAPAPESAEPEEADECQGRNPLYCGVEVGAQEVSEDDVVIMPPGGCEGRNPQYCREEGPAPTAELPPEPRKERASQGSRNPNRNPNPNPNANPNRRGRSGGGE